MNPSTRSARLSGAPVQQLMTPVTLSCSTTAAIWARQLLDGYEVVEVLARGEGETLVPGAGGRRSFPKMDWAFSSLP